MMGFTKLFSSIIHSTVWREDGHVKIVWITMLALADQRGFVSASIPGLADAARVTIPECEDALLKFKSPDPYSRTKDHEGRRIEDCDGGWRLLNYLVYRELRSKEERKIQVREAVARFRERNRAKSDVINSKHSKPRKAQAEAEAEAEAEKQQHPPTPHGGAVVAFVAFYNEITGRRLSPEAHKKFILPRVGEGVPLSAMKLAVIGACLQSFHLGENNRKKEYLDPETILRPGRLDGHAAFARKADFNIPDAETVWGFWSRGLGLNRKAVMDHFFSARDTVLAEENGKGAASE